MQATHVVLTHVQLQKARRSLAWWHRPLLKTYCGERDKERGGDGWARVSQSSRSRHAPDLAYMRPCFKNTVNERQPVEVGIE